MILLVQLLGFDLIGGKGIWALIVLVVLVGNDLIGAVGRL